MRNLDLEILEYTLRDGSYTINFQFTPREMVIITTAPRKDWFESLENGGSTLSILSLDRLP